MSRSALNKRLRDAETKTKAHQHIRDEAEARELSLERFNALMLAFDDAQRQGNGGKKFFKTLSGGELLAVRRRREDWARERAKDITPEHIATLKAQGIGIDCMTDSELYAIAAGFGDDPVDWSRLPDDVLNAIASDPDAVDWDDLARRYPCRKP